MDKNKIIAVVGAVVLGIAAMVLHAPVKDLVCGAPVAEAAK